MTPSTDPVGLRELLSAALRGDAPAYAAALARCPEALDASLHLACAIADVAAVERSAGGVDAVAGPLRATPLVYLCASRWERGDAACAARRVRIAEVLVERGADPNASYRDLEHFDGERSALSAAAKYVGSARLLEVLVTGGAAAHDHSALWATAALEKCVDDDPLACLKFMLGRRPPHWIVNAALANSLRRDDVAAVALLLDAGADPNASGGWGGSGTALHHAILFGADPRIMDQLFASGDRERRDRDGRTPFEIARRLGDAVAADKLRSLGCATPEPSPVDRAISAALAGDVRGLAQAAEHELEFGRGDHQVLTWALRRGRGDVVPRLLALGLDPNAVDDDGRSALAIAFEVGAADAVRALEQAGAGVRTFAAETVPPDFVELFEAAAQAVVDGDVDTLTRMLDDEPRLIAWRSPRPHKGTLLHYIGANGLEAHRQRTPPNAVAVLRLLLARGAEPDQLAATYGGGPAQTTLCLLVSSGWPAQAGLQRELVVELCKGGANPDGVDADGAPLATAIGFGCGDAIAGLVASGARVDNLLFAAALGRVDVVDRDVTADGRLRAGAGICRVDWLAPRTDPDWQVQRAFVFAADFGQAEVVDLLLERGVDVSCAPMHGQTALHSACYRGHERVVRALLAAGADPMLRDANFDSTCFGWALEGKRDAVIEILVEHTTPGLTDAVDLGLVDVVRAHLERDPSMVNAPDGRGGFLLWSAQRGRDEMVALLLAFGADPTLRRDGKTALDLARENGHAGVVGQLESATRGR